MREVPGSAPGPAPVPLPLVRDPRAYLLGSTVAFAAAYAAWVVLGLGGQPAAGFGGASVIPGGIVTGTMAWQVHRGRIFGELERRSSWLVVIVCALYWLSAFTTPIDGRELTPRSFEEIMFAAGIGLYPLIMWGLASMSRLRPGRLTVAIFGLDLAIVAWASAMVMWHLVLYPLASRAGTDMVDLVLLSVPPAADFALLLLAVALIRVPMRGVSRTARQLLVLAFACLFASDMALAIQAMSPPGSLAMLPDLFRSWFWAATAGVCLVLMTIPGRSEEASSEGNLSFSWLPYVGIAVAFIVPAISSWNDLAMLEQHVPASGFLVVLVLLRLAATARQNASLVASGAARLMEARFHALVQNASDVVAVTDGDSGIHYVTPSVARVLGWEPEDLVNTPLADLLHPDEAARNFAIICDVAATSGATRRAEWRLRCADGSFCEMEVLISNLLQVHEVAGLVFTARDIGQRKDLERQLSFQALHDPLTGLANRSLFVDRVEHALVRTQRRRGLLAVLFLDLDDFKQINDGHGHGVGDRLLVAIAARIAGTLRGADTVARMGGDEFAVLLEDLDDPAEVPILANRIAAAVAEPYEFGGLEAFAAVSIGVALGSGTDTDPEELLRNADVAMYVAKAKGKHRAETFDPSMHREVQDRLVLETDLRRAIGRKEFEVHYQPVWATDTRRMIGVEALVRWRHPRRGLLPPAAFIGAAEDTGLIVPIGRQVLREACMQAAAWDRAGGPSSGLSIAVNLSPRQFRETGIVETVSSALAESGLKAERLNLEITEAVLVEDSPAVAEILTRLKSLGIRISIDDFGTGYSSLSYLRRLPIDTLKIAKPFVDVVAHGPRDEALAQAIVSLARSLQLEVVAEGVEEDAQLDVLVRMGCELGQGYLVSPAVPADRLPSLASAEENVEAA
jgi:diguanylate cyclase (GGDEF)-like protein/PAS domain S-box-containing protein